MKIFHFDPEVSLSALVIESERLDPAEFMPEK
jgi:hypothetical protein